MYQALDAFLPKAAIKFSPNDVIIKPPPYPVLDLLLYYIDVNPTFPAVLMTYALLHLSSTGEATRIKRHASFLLLLQLM